MPRTPPRFPGFGGRLREAREAVGLTRNGLAMKIGKAGTYLKRWEEADQVPEDAAVWRQLRTLLRVPVVWLLLGDDAVNDLEQLQQMARDVHDQPTSPIRVRTSSGRVVPRQADRSSTQSRRRDSAS